MSDTLPKLGSRVRVAHLNSGHPGYEHSGKVMYVSELGMDMLGRSPTNVVVTLSYDWPPAGPRYGEFLPEDLLSVAEETTLRKTFARRLEIWLQHKWATLIRRR